MWIMSGITGDNLLNYVDNPGKREIFKYLTLSWNKESMIHIHISTENAARLLIDLPPEIRYTSEAPLEREQILIRKATIRSPWECRTIALGTIELMCYNRP